MTTLAAYQFLVAPSKAKTLKFKRSTVELSAPEIRHIESGESVRAVSGDAARIWCPLMQCLPLQMLGSIELLPLNRIPGADND